MAKRRIVWTKSAHLERIEILNYWYNKTKSKAYSKKLNKLFSETNKLLWTHPEIGRVSKDNSIRITIVRDYLIFYEFTTTELIIFSVWDTRRDEKDTEFDYIS
nr:type II toxin-antitoxin system RelE/ParE family toxin [uncultured Flavobacterium sp.]